MVKFNPYFNFPGKAEEAFNFYRTIFGGEFRSLVRFKDMPMPGAKTPKKDEDKIMHVALPAGKEDVLMASDALASHGFKLIQGNNVYINVQSDNKDEARRIFEALSKGGSVEMPIADQPWGDYYGSLKDKFGTLWMVNYTYPKKG